MARHTRLVSMLLASAAITDLLAQETNQPLGSESRSGSSRSAWLQSIFGHPNEHSSSKQLFPWIPWRKPISERNDQTTTVAPGMSSFLRKYGNKPFMSQPRNESSVTQHANEFYVQKLTEKESFLRQPKENVNPCYPGHTIDHAEDQTSENYSVQPEDEPFTEQQDPEPEALPSSLHQTTGNTTLDPSFKKDEVDDAASTTGYPGKTL